MAQTKTINKEAEKQEKELFRSGVNTSLYISKAGSALLTKLEKKTRRSKSTIVTLLIEKYAPDVESGKAVLL